MKSPLLYLALAIASTGFGQNVEQQTKVAADLERARELFPRFQELLATDPEKARKPFAQFLKMEDAMQLRLQTWLDAQWTEKRREYERTLEDSRPGGGDRMSDAQKQALRENRALLEEIRSIRDEEEMKERLKKEGWNALEELLVISKRNRGSARETGSGRVTEEAARALEELLTIGDFRYQVRQNRGETARKPHEELGLPSPGEDQEEAIATAAAESIEAERADRSVLEKNEKMKGEIPRDEYEGILELNQWRIAMGMNALLIDPKLCEAARDHSKDMKTHEFFDHESPVEGKKTPWDRAANFGTKASSENIAINNSPAGANKAWFHSPGHHKNMFATGRTHVGLGQEGRHYTQLFR